MKLESPPFPPAEATQVSFGLPKVLSGGGSLSFEELQQEVGSNREELRGNLAKQGALLFRDCGIRGVADFHSLMDALKIPRGSADLFFGEVMRETTSFNTMQPTLMPPDFMIGPHNETAFWYRQPEFIAFYCEDTKCAYGQTPIVDGVKVARDLPEELTHKLQSCELLNEYVFDSMKKNKDLVKNQKRNCWQRVFQTESRERVEELINERDDVEITWRKNGSLHVEVTTSVFATHPTTGEVCFRALRYFDFNNVKYMLENYAKSQMPYRKYLSSSSVVGMVSWLASKKWVEHQRYAWKTSIKNGPQLTQAEEDVVTETLFRHATIFKWHPGDVLLIDNIRTAHGRLNVDGERTLHLILSVYIDHRDIYRK